MRGKRMSIAAAVLVAFLLTLLLSLPMVAAREYQGCKRSVEWCR